MELAIGSFLKGCPIGSTPFKASNLILPSSNSKFPYGSDLGAVPVPLVSLFIHTVPQSSSLFYFKYMARPVPLEENLSMYL